MVTSSDCCSSTYQCRGGAIPIRPQILFEWENVQSEKIKRLNNNVNVLGLHEEWEDAKIAFGASFYVGQSTASVNP